jgi:hypothetical protein
MAFLIQFRIYIGVSRNQFWARFAVAACNLVRIGNLVAMPSQWGGMRSKWCPQATAKALSKGLAGRPPPRSRRSHPVDLNRQAAFGTTFTGFGDSSSSCQKRLVRYRFVLVSAATSEDRPR